MSAKFCSFFFHAVSADVSDPSAAGFATLLALGAGSLMEASAGGLRAAGGTAAEAAPLSWHEQSKQVDDVDCYRVSS